ncbi:hypothetical protein BH10PSE17_BH10PSE17_32470 [soil metagenome]
MSKHPLAGTRRQAIAAAAAASTAFLLPKSASARTPTMFETRQLPDRPDVTAPDGSDVRILPRLAGGSMAHFSIPQGKTSIAVMHRSVEEIWYFVSGQGEMWRRSGDREEVVGAFAGVSITIPLGTRFQFRSLGAEPLTAIAITMPPWPGDGEAIVVEGRWMPSTK